MKKLLLLITLLFGLQFCFSQTYQFKASSFSTSVKNRKGQWQTWTKPVDTKLIIKADGEKHRFVVYSEVIQLYEILKYEEPKETSSEQTNIYMCKDNKGIECIISVVTNKKLGNSKQLYITFEASAVMYNVVFVATSK